MTFCHNVSSNWPIAVRVFVEVERDRVFHPPARVRPHSREAFREVLGDGLSTVAVEADAGAMVRSYLLMAAVRTTS